MLTIMRVPVLRRETGSPWTAVRVRVNRVFAAHDHFQAALICAPYARSTSARMRECERESARNLTRQPAIMMTQWPAIIGHLIGPQLVSIAAIISQRNFAISSRVNERDRARIVPRVRGFQPIRLHLIIFLACRALANDRAQPCYCEIKLAKRSANLTHVPTDLMVALTIFCG